jgi:hypothetical protein
MCKFDGWLGDGFLHTAYACGFLVFDWVKVNQLCTRIITTPVHHQRLLLGSGIASVPVRFVAPSLIYFCLFRGLLINNIDVLDS